MKSGNERLQYDEKKRWLLKFGSGILLGSLSRNYSTTTAHAQSEESSLEEGFSFTSAFTSPNPNGVEEPYPGRPWTRSVSNLSGPEGRVTKWERVTVIDPKKPYQFTHDPKVGAWSMQSLLGGQPIETSGDTVVMAELELDNTPTGMNTGIIVHNGEPMKEGNHRRIVVGAKDSDLFFAFWDGSPEGNYTVNIPSISQVSYDAENRLLLSVGIYLPKDGKNSQILLPDGQTSPIINLNGSSFNNPGSRKIDVAVSTTPKVTNTIHRLTVLHKLPDPNIQA